MPESNSAPSQQDQKTQNQEFGDQVEESEFDFNDTASDLSEEFSISQKLHDWQMAAVHDEAFDSDGEFTLGDGVDI